LKKKKKKEKGKKHEKGGKGESAAAISERLADLQGKRGGKQKRADTFSFRGSPMKGKKRRGIGKKPRARKMLRASKRKKPGKKTAERMSR